MSEKTEYYNLFVGYDIKDTPEVQALAEMLFKMQSEGNKKPLFNAAKDGTTFKAKDGTETTKNIAVYLNKSDNGAIFATVKIVSAESDDDGSPF